MSSLGHHPSSLYLQRQDWSDPQQVSQQSGNFLLMTDAGRLTLQRLSQRPESEYFYAGPGNFASSLECPSGLSSLSYQGGSEHTAGLEYTSLPQDLHHTQPPFSPYSNTEFQPQPLTHNSTYFPSAAYYGHNVTEVSPNRVDFIPEQSMIGNIAPTHSDWLSYFPPSQSRLDNPGHFIQSTFEPNHYPQSIELNRNNVNGGSTRESPRMTHVVEKSSTGYPKKRGQKQAHIQHEERNPLGLIKSSLIECQGCLDDGSKCRQLISYNTCKAHLKVHFPGSHKKRDKVKCPWCQKLRGWQNLGRHFQERHMEFHRIN